MRVIQHGEKWVKEHAPIRVKCEQCGCVFEYCNADIRYKQQVYGGYYVVSCPECLTAYPLDELKRMQITEQN